MSAPILSPAAVSGLAPTTRRRRKGNADVSSRPGVFGYGLLIAALLGAILPLYFYFSSPFVFSLAIDGRIGFQYIFKKINLGVFAMLDIGPRFLGGPFSFGVSGSVGVAYRF